MVWPCAMAGIVMPSPISYHLGRTNSYGFSGFPSPAFTGTDVMWSCVFCAEAALPGAGHFDQPRGLLAGGDNQGAIRLGQPVNRLEAVPGPGFDALAQRVVHGD